jgi:TPR repeat protein
MHSFCESGNDDKCPFCNTDRGKTEEENNKDLMKRVEANDAASICVMAGSYYQGLHGLQRDEERAIELFTKSAELGFSKAHYNLGMLYHERGDLKKAKFHFEAAAMAGDKVARFNVGSLEANSGNVERAIKHWTIGASAGDYVAMHKLRRYFKKGFVGRESIDSTLAAYNASSAEMRSEARDAYIRIYL